MDSKINDRPKALRGAKLSESLLDNGKKVRIPLTQGKYAIVDFRDFKKVSKKKWYAHFDKFNWYARSHGKNDETLLMHAIILGFKGGDHWNRNGLDNCRSNLRECNNSQNMGNRGPANPLGVKGVQMR